jgi:ubiquinone/menaquinone biosynthesis C-methylase UbiE
MRMLHVAPELQFSQMLRKMFGEYVTTDLSERGVDVHADLTDLPIPDGTFDFVYASHVLEHVKDDRAALAEIRRVLAPGGMAILPVPVFTGIMTVEYPGPNPLETCHVRQPGRDYYDRYHEFFSRLVTYCSSEFDAAYQLFTYEDRSHWPTANMPLRQPMQGVKHEDIVPVCYV